MSASKLTKESIDATLARSVVDYRPETGEFFHKWRPVSMFAEGERQNNACSIWNNNWAGKRIENRNPSGYRMICISGYSVLASHVAHLIMTGVWPTDCLDHINGVRDDDRWTNIREATRAQNGQNRKVNRNNRLGLIGVSKHASRFRARITSNGKTIRLGVFDTREQAIQAYLEAKKRLHKFNPIPRPEL